MQSLVVHLESVCFILVESSEYIKVICWYGVLAFVFLLGLQLNISALDKLLGQLGIYPTWLSSIAYLQKQLRIFFIFLLCHVYGSDYIPFLIE